MDDASSVVLVETFDLLLGLEGEGEERVRLVEDWEELRLVSTMVLGWV